MILETQRLCLREMAQDDYADLCEILQDKDAMYAYEHAFSDEEAHDWLNRQLARYETYGFGLWAVIDRETGTFLGQAGLTMQDIGDEEVLEIGYLFKRRYWHHGYATEAARALKAYAFSILHAPRVYSIIRDNNIASQNVARRNGMHVVKTIVKHYYNIDMPHFVFCIENGERETL